MKSIHFDAYKKFQKRLIEARTTAGLKQEDLAVRLDRPQSYVSKVEAGDRRLDVLEYVRWMNALDSDPSPLIEALALELPASNHRRALAKRKP